MKRLLLALSLYSSGLLLSSYVIASELTRTEEQLTPTTMTTVEPAPGLKQTYIYRNYFPVQVCTSAQGSGMTQTYCYTP